MKRQYYVFSLILLISLSLAWLFLYIANTGTQSIKTILESNEAKNEQIIFDNFSHAASIMANINLQIKERYNDKDYINNILKIHKAPIQVDTFFKWTIFSWANAENKIVVDAVKGIMKEPFDLSGRDYLALTRKNPGKFYLGQAVIGSTSKKWMIPGGIGLMDKNGQHIGTMTIGFEIDALAKIVQQNLSNKNIRIKFFDSRNNLPIFYSSAGKIEHFQNKSEPVNQTIKALLEKVRINNSQSNERNSINEKIFDISILSNQHAYLAKKMSGYDYVLVLEYDSSAINKELWKSIWSKFTEIIIILTITGILMFLIYKNQKNQKKLQESNLKLEVTKNQLEEAIEIIKKSDIAQIEIIKQIRKEISKNTNQAFQILNMLKHNLENYGSSSGKLSLLLIQNIEQEIVNITNFATDELNKEYLDIRHIVDIALLSQEKEIKIRNIQLEVDYEKSLPKKVFVDQIRLTQILSGILHKTIKLLSEENQININVKIIVKNKAKYLAIKISDNGFGIGIKDHIKSMEKFGGKEESAVNGIDIPIDTIEELVKLHGGEIIYNNEIQLGSITTVIIPYIRKERKINLIKTKQVIDNVIYLPFKK